RKRPSSSFQPGAILLQHLHGGMLSMNRRYNRREALGLLGAASTVVAAACGSSPTSPTTTTTSSSTSGGTTTSSACTVSPEEPAGPYPDRTGMFSTSAFYRQDITEGKSGLPLTLALSIVNVSNACAPVANAVVEVWQCDATGNYSEYGNSVGQTFLRGLQ